MLDNTPTPAAPARELAEPDWLGSRHRISRRYRLRPGIPMVVEVERVGEKPAK
jgi:hypothetical protein